MAIAASDLTLVSGDLRAAAEAIRLSRATLRTIEQNLGWAFGYNVAALPLAAIGLLNPVLASAAMAFFQPQRRGQRTAPAPLRSMRMPRYLLHHRHDPGDCGIAFAAFKGHPSPLRRDATIASCLSGDHAIWWLVDAPTPEDALELLPFFLARRSSAVEVRQVMIP